MPNEREMRLIAQGREALRPQWDEWDYKASDAGQKLPAPPVQRPVPSDAQIIALPPVSETGCGQCTLESAMTRRKSTRKYTPTPISINELSFMLWAMDGVRSQNSARYFSTIPSGGASHCLEIYVYLHRVDGLERGIYRYLPLDHSLCLQQLGDFSEQIDIASQEQFWDSSVFVMWAARPYRMEYRYSYTAHKMIAMEAGHSCQNLQLAAEAVDCGSCALAAYDQKAMDTLLGLDGDELFTIYVAPVGKHVKD